MNRNVSTWHQKLEQGNKCIHGRDRGGESMPHVKLWELIHLVLARAVMGEGTHSEGSFASL